MCSMQTPPLSTFNQPKYAEHDYCPLITKYLYSISLVTTAAYSQLSVCAACGHLSSHCKHMPCEHRRFCHLGHAADVVYCSSLGICTAFELASTAAYSPTCLEAACVHLHSAPEACNQEPKKTFGLWSCAVTCTLTVFECSAARIHLHSALEAWN